MSGEPEHDELEAALRRCGAGWDAAQTHGLLASRLAVDGVDAGVEWLAVVLADTDSANALVAECRSLLGALYETTHRALAERQSAFELLLPDDGDSPERRTRALAHWCEGFLHGLVSAGNAEALKERLAAEPLGDIIKDLLQMTRASFDADEDADESEQAYAELVEYVRVAAQYTYEELADLRGTVGGEQTSIH